MPRGELLGHRGNADDGSAVLGRYDPEVIVQPGQRRPAVDVNEHHAGSGGGRAGPAAPRAVVPGLVREHAVLRALGRPADDQPGRGAAPPRVTAAGSRHAGQPAARRDVQRPAVLLRHLERALDHGRVLRRAEQPAHDRGDQPGHVHVLHAGRNLPVGGVDPAAGERVIHRVQRHHADR